MKSDTSERIHFRAHGTLAEETFFKLRLICVSSFRGISWSQVYDTLPKVPQLFQLWAYKEVTDAAGTNLKQARYPGGPDPHCPSGDSVLETCTHMLHCKEAGRVEALRWSIDWLDNCLKEVGTEQSLCVALVEYARGRGNTRMEDVTWGIGPGFCEMGRSHNKIGWQCFMEGVILK